MNIPKVNLLAYRFKKDFGIPGRIRGVKVSINYFAMSLNDALKQYPKEQLLFIARGDEDPPHWIPIYSMGKAGRLQKKHRIISKGV